MTQIKGKIIANTLAITVDGEKLSRKVTSEQALEILALISTYEANPTEETKSKILEMMGSKAAKIKAEISEEEEKVIRKEYLFKQLSDIINAGGLTNEEVDQLLDLYNNGEEIKKEEPKPVSTYIPYGGEH